MFGMNSAPAPTKVNERGELEAGTGGTDTEKEFNNPEYEKLQEKMLFLAKDGDYGIIVGILKEVTEKYPDLFFSHDTEFENQFNHYMKAFGEEGAGGDYYSFIEKVIKPFWRKVDAAGKEEISSGYFSALSTMY